MAKYFLYLFLAGHSPLEVPGFFNTLDECAEAGQREVARWALVHTQSPGFAWCVKGGVL